MNHAREQIESLLEPGNYCDWHGRERDAVMLISGMLFLCLECAEDLGYELSAWSFRKRDSAVEAGP